jgi:predicted RNA methylase
MQLTAKMLEFAPIDSVWLEPAGGTGAFVDAMLSLGIKDIESYDIDPHHDMVKFTKNFLKEDVSKLSECVTITNPPFGRANKLSVPFFNKCAEVSTHIGFVVPKSWRKWSVIDRLDNRFHLIYDQDLNIDYHHEEESDDKKGRLSTIFQIWEKRNYTRPKTFVEDRGYISTATPKKADICITSRGRGCGLVKTEFKRVENTTQTFLSVSREWVVDAMKSIDFSVFYNNTAFVESLSVKEIMYLVNKYADENESDILKIRYSGIQTNLLGSCLGLKW